MEQSWEEYLPKIRALWKEKGSLSLLDILQVVPELDPASPSFSSFLEYLKEQGISVLKEEKEEGGFREADDEAFAFYLSQMSHIPLLSQEEEIQLAEQLAEARSNLRRLVLGTRLAITESIRILEKVVNRELPLEKTLTVRSNKKISKDVLLEKLSRVIDRLKRMVRLNTQDWDKICLGHFSEEDRKKIRRRIQGRIYRAVQLLEQFHIHLPQILYWRKKILETWEQLKYLREEEEHLKKRISSLRSPKELVEKRLYYQEKLWESMEELTARVKKLEREYQRYKEAKDRLCQGNLRLVINIAKRYRGKGLPFIDLIQEGNTGLMRAVEKFDHLLGFRFSTYATWWIRQSITRAIAEKSRLVRLPIYLSDLLLRVKHAQAKFIQEWGREPEPEELAERVGLSLEETSQLLQLAKKPLSLSLPLYQEEEEGCLADTVARDEKEGWTVERYESFLKCLKELLEHLGEQEKEVLCLRYGLTGDRCYTLEELGKKYGVTRERIRQIERSAIRKLKSLRPAEDLELLLEFLPGF